MGTKDCHMIPEKEKQCVWMTAGLISYKLCNREYRCEECLFDRVMRNEAVHDAGYPPATVSSGSRPPQIQGALFYHQNHCWAQVESPDEVRAGINAILAALVSQVKTVVLPNAGDAVTQGQCFAHIIQQRHIVPLISPVSGTIFATNANLKNNPELIVSDPWDNGWLVTIRPDTLEQDLRMLLCGSRAIEWYQKREQEAVLAGNSITDRDRAVIGPTLQDGGERVACLADTLSAEQYCRIIESLSRMDDPPA
jgi:glycine cleavage system H protein